MYFDPGMGSLIIQAIIAALAVVGGYLIVAKNKLKNALGKKREETREKDLDGEEDDAL